MSPEFLESTRAEVTIEDLKANHAEFVATCKEYIIDVMTVEGSRRVGNINGSGTSSTKAGSKSSSERLIMPSSFKARPMRKTHPNRGRMTSLNGGTQAA